MVVTSKIGFEFRVWPYIVGGPFVNLLAWTIGLRKKYSGQQKLERNTRLFDGLPVTGEIRANAGKWRALDIIYNWQGSAFARVYGESRLSQAILWPLSWVTTCAGRFLENYWLNNRNCQAVRNRRRLVTAIIQTEIQKRRASGQGTRILSIASGSAQCVFEAIVLAGKQGVEVLCIDSDPTALAYSQRLAVQYGLEDCVSWIESDFIRMRSMPTEFHPDIVEVVGLFDYLVPGTIIRLLKWIRNVLTEDGLVLTAHIHENGETPFVRNIIDWSMRYKPKDEFENIMSQGGFDQCKFITTPHGIHTVAVGEK